MKDAARRRAGVAMGLFAIGAAVAFILPLSDGALAAPAASGPAGAGSGGMKTYAQLPDWSGMWKSTDPMTGSIFDGSAVKPGDNETTIRDYPPYRPEWEARYDAFLKKVVRTGKYVDPLSAGLPAGFPRFVSMPRAYQFALRPEQAWFLYERPDVRYIYTDGRSHPSEDEWFPTWSGHSIGRWEGDTLVVDTVGTKGGITLDRTGLVLSEKAHIVERIRKVDPKHIEDQVTIEDADAFTKPWTIVRHYRKLGGVEATQMDDVPSLENNRNPLVDGATGTLLQSDYEDGQTYPKNVRELAVPQ